MSVARTWLPKNVTPTPALHALVEEVTDDWSRCWFPGVASGRVATMLGPMGRSTVSGLEWYGLDRGVSLGQAPGLAVATGACMLDLPAEGRGGEDLRLLAALGEDGLADLRARLATLVQAPGDTRWRPCATAGGWTATLALPGASDRASVAIGLSDTVFATLLRRGLPMPMVAPLGSATEALAATRVTVGAAIGRATMSVAELRMLAAGDVVVLDRPIAAAVPLAVDAFALPRGRARVVADPHPALHIVSPPKE